MVADEYSESFCKQIEKKYKKKGLKRPIYVIQKHDASRLHYDLRLEFDSKLKSWAIPKTPPRKINDKKLAIAVPDHPIEYAKFEGQIPEGNYGAGKVEIWDRGTFDTLEKTKKKIVVKIQGKRLGGKYCLINFRPKEKSWLFFKMKE
ncbi:MAG: 3'-phosphoesterase [Nitrosopumilaceae archaeon]|nr:3'-phosphoesterase [Nitrosopumilaceae archaeon]NIU00351.1 3'-phosphoesterase [Nitrosopumilaceae archaeon]NIU86753.1 3'-phosphoesterase [Nitrosopumilaceae archaeon]NIV65453.1 3'-phosphoesterase [Nitrosopumilaceae archaeon]NIX60953.1 3'-phosphoesterase [Nitrosopumilaceae archaeon]